MRVGFSFALFPQYKDNTLNLNQQIKKIFAEIDFLYYLCINKLKKHIMETISIIFETLCRIVYAIVGGAISIAFIVGVTSALGYMFYYIVKYGWKAFEKEFIPN